MGCRGLGVDGPDRRTIELLNEDLFGEHDAIVYYLTHAWTVARRYGRDILDIAYDEMRHFKWLAHAIAQMGGVPDLKTPSVAPVTTLQAALQKDVDAEIHAIDQYRDHMEVIPRAPLRGLLERIVVDEQAHLRHFQELLDSTHGEPDEVDRPAAEVGGVAAHLQNSVGQEYQQMMAYLMKSFVEDHGRRMGLDMEERSIDEMRHMGWIAKQMGVMGLQPQFPPVDAEAAIAPGEQREQALYQDVRAWAVDALPTLVPTIDRILAQEQYHATLQP